jgi:MORN repeat
MKPYEIDKIYYISHISLLIKSQSLAKKFVYRSRFLKILIRNNPSYYYFSYKEVTQFLSKISGVPEYRESTKGKFYPDGGIYVGDLRGGFRDGDGVMRWKDGSYYDGEWSFGRPFGQGTFTFLDGESYAGRWKYYFSKGNESDISGLGLILWKENVKDGYKWLWYKKTISINSPRSIAMTPRNEEKLLVIQEKYLQIKHYYDLNLSNIKASKHAIEKYYPDGSVYKGDMQGSQKQGYGKIVWVDGDTYEGEWKDDIQNGWGKNIWKEGSSYSGFFVNNLKDGVGLYYWQDGTEYFGEWKCNKMNGVGKYKWNDGKIYLGEWVDGNMEGFGAIVWKDGRKYEGSWHIGKKHGEGVTFYTNGRVSRDVWRYGKIIKPDV